MQHILPGENSLQRRLKLSRCNIPGHCYNLREMTDVQDYLSSLNKNPKYVKPAASNREKQYLQIWRPVAYSNKVGPNVTKETFSKPPPYGIKSAEGNSVARKSPQNAKIKPKMAPTQRGMGSSDSIKSLPITTTQLSIQQSLNNVAKIRRDNSSHKLAVHLEKLSFPKTAVPVSDARNNTRKPLDEVSNLQRRLKAAKFVPVEPRKLRTANAMPKIVETQVKIKPLDDKAANNALDATTTKQSKQQILAYDPKSKSFMETTEIEAELNAVPLIALKDDVSNCQSVIMSPQDLGTKQLNTDLQLLAVVPSKDGNEAALVAVPKLNQGHAIKPSSGGVFNSADLYKTSMADHLNLQEDRKDDQAHVTELISPASQTSETKESIVPYATATADATDSHTLPVLSKERIQDLDLELSAITKEMSNFHLQESPSDKKAIVKPQTDIRGMPMFELSKIKETGAFGKPTIEPSTIKAALNDIADVAGAKPSPQNGQTIPSMFECISNPIYDLRSIDSTKVCERFDIKAITEMESSRKKIDSFENSETLSVLSTQGPKSLKFINKITYRGDDSTANKANIKMHLQLISKQLNNNGPLDASTKPTKPLRSTLVDIMEEHYAMNTNIAHVLKLWPSNNQNGKPILKEPNLSLAIQASSRGLTPSLPKAQEN